MSGDVGEETESQDLLSRLEALFFELCEQPPAERQRRLREIEDENPVLHAELASLLDADGADCHLLDEPEDALGALAAGALRRGALPDPLLGLQLGAYRLRQRLGAGGMSTVYLAERSDGAFEQRCAVKVVRRGIDTEAVIERFHGERHILAQLRHPLITRLLDGGATPDGRPYLVMEYVEGEPVDTYCRRHQLSVAEILRLVIEICGAVDHAHRRLVVHRDIKPANVLVTPDGSPRLLDFGVARLLDRDAAGAQAPTTARERFLTPEYASPEQLRGGAITTAIDVYSLGLLLYELLTGSHPFSDRVESRVELIRAVSEDDPPPPSRLRPALAGDLDAIVQKALRKEPADRYASVADLAEDLRRHLRLEPVAARRGHRLYRLGRFLRRRRLPLAVAAVLLVFAALAVAGIVRERDRALAAQERTAKVGELLINLLELPDPVRGQAMAPLDTENLVERAAFHVDSELHEDPELRSQFLIAVGRVTRNLGDARRAHQLMSTAEHSLEELDRPELRAEVAFRLAELEIQRDLFAAAEAHLETLDRLAPRTRQENVWRARGLALLASLRDARGDDDAREAIERAAALVDEERHPELASWVLGIAARIPGDGEPETAIAEAERALELAVTAFGATHPIATDRRETLALAWLRAGRLDEAEEALLEVLHARRETYGETHPSLASSSHHLATVSLRRRDFATGEKWLRQATDLAAATMGEETLHWAESALALADVLRLRGEPEEARRYLDSATRTFRRVLGEDSRFTILSELLGCVTQFLAADDPAALDAVEARTGGLLEALDHFPEADPRLLDEARTDAHHLLAQLAARRGRHETAHRHLEAAAKLLPEDRLDVRQEMTTARVLHLEGRVEEAAERLRELTEATGERGGIVHVRALLEEAETALDAGRLAVAREKASEALEPAAKIFGEDSPFAARARLVVALSGPEAPIEDLRRELRHLPPGDASPQLWRVLEARGVTGPGRRTAGN